MRYIMMALLIFGLSGCSVQKSGLSQKEYQRSNAASENSLNKLDKE